MPTNLTTWMKQTKFLKDKGDQNWPKKKVTTLIPLSRKKNSDARNSRKAKTRVRGRDQQQRSTKDMYGDTTSCISGLWWWPHNLIQSPKLIKSKLIYVNDSLKRDMCTLIVSVLAICSRVKTQTTVNSKSTITVLRSHILKAFSPK